jgi:hypothetical protein
MARFFDWIKIRIFGARRAEVTCFGALAPLCRGIGISKAVWWMSVDVRIPLRELK